MVTAQRNDKDMQCGILFGKELPRTLLGLQTIKEGASRPVANDLARSQCTIELTVLFKTVVG